MHRHSRIHSKDGQGSPSLKDAHSRSSSKKSDDQMSIGSSTASSSKKRSLEISAASLSNTKRRLYEDDSSLRYNLEQPLPINHNLLGAYSKLGWPMEVPIRSEEV